MQATEFCHYFEFSLNKEHGFDDDGSEYNYAVVDDQGVFDTRYIMQIDELVNCFDVMLRDYVEDYVEDNGFEYDSSLEKTYYEQALQWIIDTDLAGTDTHWVIAALVDPKTLADDTAEEWYSLNMDESYKGIRDIDEWGMAVINIGKIGAEYNYCYDDEGEDSSAIYFMYERDDGYWTTDGSDFERHHINWREKNWQEKLKDHMYAFVKRHQMEGKDGKQS